MIREFWAENYKSIRDKQILNFECKSKEDSVASVEMGNGVRLNKLGIIYGANASESQIFFMRCRMFLTSCFFPVLKRMRMLWGMDLSL